MTAPTTFTAKTPTHTPITPTTTNRFAPSPPNTIDFNSFFRPLTPPREHERVPIPPSSPSSESPPPALSYPHSRSRSSSSTSSDETPTPRTPTSKSTKRLTAILKPLDTNTTLPNIGKEISPLDLGSPFVRSDAPSPEPWNGKKGNRNRNWELNGYGYGQEKSLLDGSIEEVYSARLRDLLEGEWHARGQDGLGIEGYGHGRRGQRGSAGSVGSGGSSPRKRSFEDLLGLEFDERAKAQRRLRRGSLRGKRVGNRSGR